MDLLEIANAEMVGNVTNGTIDLRITEAYQDLEPDFGNMVNVTLTLATNSQVSHRGLPLIMLENWCTFSWKGCEPHVMRPG